jgi:MFS family permease
LTGLADVRRRANATWRVIRAVIRNPALRRVLLAYLLFATVEFGTWIAVLLWAYAAIGPASVGLVAAAQLLPAALFAAASSSIADRYPRHRVLLAGYLLQGVAFAAGAAGMGLGASSVVVVVAAAAAASLLTLTRPAQGSLLPTLARTPDELTAANALAGTVEGAGLLLGPLAAATILLVGTPGVVLGAGAAACGLAAMLVTRLPVAAAVPAVAVAGADTDGGGSEIASESAVDRLLGGLRVLADGGETRLIVLIMGLRMVVSGAMDVLFVMLALQVLGTGESGAGVLNASLGLGTLAGGAVSFVLIGRRSMAGALALSVTVLGVALVLIGGGAPAALVPVLLAAGGIGYATIDVVGRTILQRVTDDRRLARLLGALEGIGLVGLSIGSALAPLVITAIGIQHATIAIGLVMPMAVVLSWVGLRRIDRRANVPVRELALLRANTVLSPLPVPQLESVARHTRWATYDVGEMLIREGDRGDRYYVLASGSLRVTAGGRHLRDASIVGDGLGEIALLRDVPRTATVTALTPVVTLTLERGEFLEAVTCHEQAHKAGRRVAAEREPDGGTGPGAAPG